MRVLADYHHHDLWESMEILFPERLGWSLIRPIGMEWFEQGYWNHERKWHGDAVAKQYLEPWGDDYACGMTYGMKPATGYFNRYDKSHGRVQVLATLDQLRDEPPDIVISSLAHNHEGMARFASEVGAIKRPGQTNQRDQIRGNDKRPRSELTPTINRPYRFDLRTQATP